MADELTPEDWDNAKWLLELSDVQLHKLRLGELREGANLLLAVSDMCKQRGRALHKFCDGYLDKRGIVVSVEVEGDKQRLQRHVTKEWALQIAREDYSDADIEFVEAE